ncbi:MAG TPA: MoaD/ThiS family protein [bacterium]
MPTVHFTANLQRYMDVPSREVPGRTVREAMEAIFAETPRLRSYIVDDQGRLRQHVLIFVDGQTINDRTGLADAVQESSELYVMQALSGG